MGKLRGIFLILFAFLTFAFASVFVIDNQPISFQDSGNISTIGHFENDIINSKTFETNLSSIRQNNSTFFNLRRNNNQFGCSCDFLLSVNNFIQIAYNKFRLKTFLASSRNSISFLLFQVQPNAP